MDESDLEEFDNFVEKYWGDEVKKTRRTRVAKTEE